jgi:uncharacterized membrane protein YtjA (UPF0391 family)
MFVLQIVVRCCEEPVPRREVSVHETIEGSRKAAPMSELAMTILKWALIFLLISIVAGVLGFTGISAASADIARFLFYVFVVIFLVLLVLGLTLFRA